jgi:hypothetical protein
VDIRVYLCLRNSGRYFSIRYFFKGVSSELSSYKAFLGHRAEKKTPLRFFTHKRSSIMPGIIRMLAAASRHATEVLIVP